jgi:hypothetical protein
MFRFVTGCGPSLEEMRAFIEGALERSARAARFHS